MKVLLEGRVDFFAEGGPGRVASVDRLAGGFDEDVCVVVIGCLLNRSGVRGLTIVCHPLGACRWIVHLTAIDCLFGVALHPLHCWVCTGCVVPAAIVHEGWLRWERHCLCSVVMS